MKNLLLLFFLGFIIPGFAQVNSVLPAEANTFYNNAMPSIKPEIKSIIEKNANKLKERNINPDSLLDELHKDQRLKNFNRDNLEALAVLIMVHVSKNADADLKNLVISMHQKQIEKPADEISTENTNPALKVQSILANKSQIAEIVSLVMKDLSGTTEKWIQVFM